MNQGPVIRLQKDAFSFLLLFFPGSLKKKKKKWRKNKNRKVKEGMKCISSSETKEKERNIQRAFSLIIMRQQWAGWCAINH